MREEYEEERRLISDAEICRKILSLASFRYANAILLYAPINGEIDVMPIAKAVLDSGKTLCFPKCYKHISPPKMEFRIVKSLDEISPGTYGISEPAESCPLYQIENETASSICIVPALTYSSDGYRLGYGGGYYDCYLSEYKGTKIGVVYEDFIANEIPVGKYDMSVDVLITERKIRVIGL